MGQGRRPVQGRRQGGRRPQLRPAQEVRDGRLGARTGGRAKRPADERRRRPGTCSTSAARTRASERLEREIEKLALYCRGAEATAEDVDAVCTPDDEARIFDLMDAVGHRDRRAAFVLLEAIFASGDPGKTPTASSTASCATCACSRRVAAGRRATRARPPSSCGVHPFTAKKLLEQRKNYDRRRLDKAYRALAVAELGMRGRAPATLESGGRREPQRPAGASSWPWRGCCREATRAGGALERPARLVVLLRERCLRRAARQRCATRLFLWAALFLWMTPLAAALSMREVRKTWPSSRPRRARFSATCVSRRLNSVLSVDLVCRLRSRCLVARRMRFFCCLMLAT